VKTQASWRKRNPSDGRARRLEAREATRAGGGSVPEPMRPPLLREVPWDIAKDQFGAQGADFIADLARVLLRGPKDQMPTQVVDSS
jgi:hypothetical protein